MLTVEKIGGTSMSEFKDVLHNIILHPTIVNTPYKRVFVVSAYNNVTNWLLEHKKTGEPGIYQQFLIGNKYEEELDALLLKLIDINKKYIDLGLDLKEADDFITYRIEQAKQMLRGLKQVLASGYVNQKDIHLAAREILASLGEAHSAWNSTNIIQNNGLNCRFVDLCGFDDNLPLTIDQRIKNAFEGIDLNTEIAVVTGYTKGTEGIMRAFDRGYSEVTFSKIAVEINADEAVIHKEYHLSSADPKIVGPENSIPVGQTNYIIADQLADIGMEAIHPKAAKPLELAGINIRIKNTFEPDHLGTLISKEYKSPVARIEIVSGAEDMRAIEIHDPLMVSEVGYDRKLMLYFEKHHVSYVLKSTNANSITMVVWDNKNAEALINELKGAFYQINDMPVAMVCAMGTNLAGPGFLYKATKALYENNINIECYGQSLMQVNLQFVIKRPYYKKAIIALNDALCNN